MNIKNDMITPFDYSKGKEFTEKLKKTTGCSTLLEMASLFDMPKATFSTWNLHNRTSHELMIRMLMRGKISLKELEELALTDDALQQHLQLKAKQSQNMGSSLGNQHYSANIAERSNLDPLIYLRSYNLDNGRLIETEEIPYARRRIKDLKLQNANLIEIVTNNRIYLVDKNIKDAMSGDYLIDIDKRHSINTIQRLPKKLIIEFDKTKVDIAETDINVIGKVVVTICC